MRHEQKAQEIYWAMEHGDLNRADLLIENLVRTGIRAYAWWKDGRQYVGTTGKTLENALKTENLPPIV